MQVCAAVVEIGAAKIEPRADVGGGREIHMIERLSDGGRAAEDTGDAILLGNIPVAEFNRSIAAQADLEDALAKGRVSLNGGLVAHCLPRDGECGARRT